MTTMPAPLPTSGFDARHEPVLVAEVVEALRPKGDGRYVDATLGLGGHTRALLAAGAGHVIGIDRDRRALDEAALGLGEAGGRVEFVHADYRELATLATARHWDPLDGVLVDLGVSSFQLDDPARGFSFRAAGPLDMRMDPSRGTPLSTRLAAVDAETLADVIWQFGEERHSRRIARAIVEARDRGGLGDTTALASVVRRASGGRGWQRVDPATRTFQALRIWVNEELEGLDRFIEDAVALLGQGGRFVAIAFHSLEDRIVKHTVRRLAVERPGVSVVTRRPVTPGDDECARNPRARSARMRVVERTV
jgi:16S rRNA (cytosine1402-N4)-methyltransferase